MYKQLISHNTESVFSRLGVKNIIFKVKKRTKWIIAATDVRIVRKKIRH